MKTRSHIPNFKTDKQINEKQETGRVQIVKSKKIPSSST